MTYYLEGGWLTGAQLVWIGIGIGRFGIEPSAFETDLRFFLLGLVTIAALRGLCAYNKFMGGA